MESFLNSHKRHHPHQRLRWESLKRAQTRWERRLCLEALEERSLLSLPTSFADLGYAIATDSADNAYVAGSFRGTVDFDPNLGLAQTWRTAPGAESDGFLAKFAPDKSLVWVKTFTGGGMQAFTDIAVDPAGFIHAVGVYRGETVDFSDGTSYYVAPEASTTLVAKLDSLGNICWATTIGDSRSPASVVVSGHSLALDGRGSVYINGTFTGGTFQFGNSTVNNQGNDQFVAKLAAADGAALWARNVGTTDVIWTGDVAADATGVYTSGLFNGTVLPADPNQFQNQGSTSAQDSYVIKFSASDGSVLWTKQFIDQRLPDDGGSIEADGESLYVAAPNDDGGTSLNGLVARYNPDGSEVWSRPWGRNDTGGMFDSVRDICVRGDSVYLTGSVAWDPLDFDLDPNSAYIVTPIVEDVFVWKIGKDSSFGWVRQMGLVAKAGGYPADYGTGIAVDSAGNVWTTGALPGHHTSFADYDPSPSGVAAFRTEFNQDAFVSKLSANGEYVLAFQIGQVNSVTDNGDTKYSEAGTGWQDGVFKNRGLTTGTGWGGDSRYHLAGKGANKAQWQFTGLDPGSYELHATWPTNITLDRKTTVATNATYQVSNGVTTTAIVANQRLAPDPVGGTGWKSLGTCTIGASGSISISLSDAANGVVIADAIVLVGLGAAPVGAAASGASGVRLGALYDAALAATLASSDAGSRAAASLVMASPPAGTHPSTALADAATKLVGGMPTAQTPHATAPLIATSRRGPVRRLETRSIDHLRGGMTYNRLNAAQNVLPHD